MPTETLTILRDLGAVGIVALAVLVLAITLYRLVKSTGDSDIQDKGILKQMIDLATSYKSESADAREAYRQEAIATRNVVQESNDTHRAMIESMNIQTGEIRLLRSDFKNYQTLNSDTISGLRTDFDTLRKEVVEHVERLIKQSEENAQDHVESKKDRAELHRKLDLIIDMANKVKHDSKPIPIIDTDTPASSEPDAGELPKASGQ